MDEVEGAVVLPEAVAILEMHRRREPVTPPPLTAVQLALYAGWTMAVLYGHLEVQPVDRPELRTANELQPRQRRELELARLRHLLQHLSSIPAIGGSDLKAKIPPYLADPDEFRAALTDLNLSILEALTASPPDVQVAYELGRSLRDTVNPPISEPGPAVGAGNDPELVHQLSRDRVAKLQERLATLAGQLPAHAAAVVATSLGRWSEFATVTIGGGSGLSSDDRAEVEAVMRQHLLPQGDTWLMLLTGGRATTGLLSPEGYGAAATEALNRTVMIIRNVLRHYWFAAIIVAAALAGVLYLIVSNLAGAPLVWTSIAAIGGSVGASASTVASSSRRLAAEAEHPVFAVSEEDVMAWAVTMLPEVNLSYRSVRKLRKAGIAPSSNLGRI